MPIVRRKDKQNRVLRDGEYQRNNGTYEYRCRDYKGHRHSIYAKSLEELRKKEKDLQIYSEEEADYLASEITINDLYEQWKLLKKGLKRNTLFYYDAVYMRNIYEDFGRMKIKNLKRSTIKRFYIDIYERKHYGINSMKQIQNILRQILQMAVEDELLRTNPADNALRDVKRMYGLTQEKKKALTIQETNIFLEFLKNDLVYNRWYPFFTFLLFTGLRVSEAMGLRWCDVDFRKDEISVNHTLAYCSETKYSLIINTPKTKTGNRIVPLLPQAKEALISQKKSNFKNGITCNVEIDGYKDFIFLNKDGNVSSNIVLDKTIKRIIKACNEKNQKENKPTLPIFGCHTLRHTFTTRMCEANVNIKVLQEILGHSNIQTTLQIYADATEEFKKEEFKKVSGLMQF